MTAMTITASNMRIQECKIFKKLDRDVRMVMYDHMDTKLPPLEPFSFIEADYYGLVLSCKQAYFVGILRAAKDPR
jgi:hypothetical protein